MTVPVKGVQRDAPTYADVLTDRAQARDLAEQVVAAEPEWVAEVATTAGATAGGAAGAQVARRFGLVGLVGGVIIAVLISLLAYGNSVTTDREVGLALERLSQANDTLTARGQDPVATPAAQDPAGVIAAAVTAQVLASLPSTPTAEQVADRLQGVVIGSLSGPSMNELARLVAVYFSENPPQPGPAPTQAQIQAAVDAAIAANPPEDGQDGESPPCLSTPAMCQGEDGEAGADGLNGRSVTSGPQPVRLDDGSCVFRVTYDREPLVEEFPAGDDACPDGDPDLPGLGR